MTCKRRSRARAKRTSACGAELDERRQGKPNQRTAGGGIWLPRDPRCLGHVDPPWENMRLVEFTGSLRPGSRVVLRGQVWIVPVRWVACTPNTTHLTCSPTFRSRVRSPSGITVIAFSTTAVAAPCVTRSSTSYRWGGWRSGWRVGSCGGGLSTCLPSGTT
jgi:hypothetical protein